MARHACVFVGASCVAPLIGMVHFGIRALTEPIKFSLDWIPLLILVWAAIAAACFGVSACVSNLASGWRGVSGRNLVLTAIVGCALGLSYALDLGWLFVASLLLGPVLFRRRAT